MKAYTKFARAIAAIDNCRKSGNTEWLHMHEETLMRRMQSLPSGGGFDHAISLDNASTPERLMFNVEFHHMDEHGYYDGWSSHTVIVTPSLQFGYKIRVTGRDRNGIKDYISEVFDLVMIEETGADGQ